MVLGTQDNSTRNHRWRARTAPPVRDRAWTLRRGALLGGVSALALAGGLVPTPTRAAAVSWTAGTGLWGTGTNWSGAATPGSGDDVTIAPAGTGNIITHGSLADTINTVTLTAGNTVDITGGSLQINAGGTVAGEIISEAATSLGLAGGVVDAAGGTLLANGGVVGLSGGVSVQGGTLASAAGGVVQTSVSNSAILDGGSAAGALTNAGAYQLNDNSTTYLNGTIANTGKITFASGGNSVFLRIDNTTTLTGSGQVVLGEGNGGQASHNVILGNANNGTETLVNANNTISGGGNVGGGGLVVVNQGVIDANDTATNLTVAPATGGSALQNGAGFVNQGMLEATGGANLVLGNGTYNNATGTILAANGGVFLENGADIQGGLITSSGTGLVHTDSGQNITLDGGSAAGVLTNAGAYQLNDNSTTFLNGTIANTGTVTFFSQGSGVNLKIDNTTTLTGGGQVVMGEGSGGQASHNVILGNANNGTETLVNANNTISGGGNLGGGGLVVVNQGVIDANDTTTNLTVAPAPGGSAVTAQGGAGFVNQGMLEATGGANLVLGNGTYNNATGTILAANGGVLLENGADIQGGLITSSGTGVVHTDSGQNITLDGGSAAGALTNAGAYQLNNNSSTFLNGTIANSGTITFFSQGAGTNLRIDNTTTLTGGGEVLMGGTNAAQNVIQGNNNNGTETLINTNNTIAGGGNIGNGGLEVVNHALIEATNAVAALNINPATGGAVLATQGGAGFVNQGMLEANGGNLVLNNGVYNNQAGTILAAGTNVLLNGGADIQGGLLNSSGGGMVQSVGVGGPVILDGQTRGTLTNAGTYQLNDNSTTVLDGAIANTGTISFASVGNGTRLNIANSGTTMAVTLTGGGEVLMGGTNAAQNVIQGNNNNGTETLINTNNTIAGGGNIGNGGLEVVNHALIEATNAVAALNINPATGGAVLATQGGAGFVNQGMLEANGGNLVLNNGVYNNQGGTILAAGTNVLLTGGADIQGGLLNSSSGGMVQSVGVGGPVILDGQTRGTLTNAGTYQLNDNSTTVLDGAIANTGTISFASVGNGTRLNIANSGTTMAVTLTGGGEVLMGGTSAAQNVIQGNNNNGTETLINTNNTIAGGGNIGNGGLEVVNHALIEATNAAAALNISPATGGAVVTAQGAGFVNQGVLEANGGNLQLNGGVYNNQAGTILAAGTNVLLNGGADIQGGLLNSSGGGMVQTLGSQNVTLDGQTQGALTNAGTYQLDDNSTTVLSGVIANSGTISFASVGNGTRLNIANGGTATAVTLTGGGQVVMGGASAAQNVIEGNNNNGTETLINANNTIIGGGNIGNNGLVVENAGVIDGNNATVNLTLAPAAAGTAVTAAGAGLVNTGLIEGTGAAGVTMTQGAINNQGTLQALDGSFVTLNGNVTTQNNSAGTLTGGTWNAIANGHGATLSITGGPVVTDAANITVSGAGSTFQSWNGSSEVALETSLTTIDTAGALHVLNNRNYTTTNDIATNGLLDLGGGTFTANSQTIGSTGTLSGFGTVTNTNGSQLANAGQVIATGGVLTVSQGLSGPTGNATSNSGATLDLSSATTGSTVGTLANNGTLALGSQNVTVSTDYTNANFGTGNSFNKRANVTGTGQILAAGTPGQTLTLNGATAVTGATGTMTFHNVHVGSSTTQTYTVNNTGTGGPVLRGAIQTSVNGGNITSAALSGTGVTAGNFGPIAQGSATGTLAVTYAPTAAGALSGQAVHVANNFSNVGEQTLSIAGAAYDLAAPTVAPSPIAFGNHHVGDVITQQALTVSNNTVSNASFQEGLNASVSGTTGGVTTNNGSFSNLAAGTSNTSAIAVGIDTSTAGSKNGTATLALTSNGSIDGLTNTSLAAKSVNVTGAVYNLASSNAIAAVSFGVLHTGSGTISKALTITNTAPTGSFSEGLNSSFGTYTNSAGTLNPTFAGTITNLAAGSTDNSSMTVSINTATAGTVSGTVAVDQASNGSIDGLGNTALSTQNVGVSGTVNATITNLAAPQINNAPIAFGNVRVGTAIATQGVSVTNAAPVNAFTEGLIASTAGQTPTGGVTESGGFGSVGSGLAGGATNATGIQVGIDTATAGNKSGNAVVHFQSDGTPFAGGVVTDLGTTNVAVTGNVFRLATGSVTTPVSLGAARVGGTLSGAVTVTNTAAADGFSENLDAAFTGAPTGNVASATGSVTGLAAGGSDSSHLTVALDTSTAGARTGTATVALSSDGTGIDGGAPVVVATQAATVTGNVYAPAVANVTTTTVNFGVVHVGDTVTPGAIAVTNGAASAGLNDTLVGGVGSITQSGGAFSAGAAIAGGGLGAGASGSVGVALNTGTSGTFTGTANLALASHDAQLADLALTTSGVTLAATVDNYAVAGFTKTSGAGSFGGGAGAYTLNLGNLIQGSGAVAASLGGGNLAGGLADLLSGSLGITSGAGDFTLGGLGSFSGLGAGQVTGISLNFNPVTLGLLTETISLTGSGSNASGYNAAVGGASLTITADVLASGPVPTPEPGSLPILAGGIAALAWAANRRRRIVPGRAE